MIQVSVATEDQCGTSRLENGSTTDDLVECFVGAGVGAGYHKVNILDAMEAYLEAERPPHVRDEDDA